MEGSQASRETLGNGGTQIVLTFPLSRRHQCDYWENNPEALKRFCAYLEIILQQTPSIKLRVDKEGLLVEEVLEEEEPLESMPHKNPDLYLERDREVEPILAQMEEMFKLRLLSSRKGLEADKENEL